MSQVRDDNRGTKRLFPDDGQEEGNDPNEKELDAFVNLDLGENELDLDFAIGVVPPIDVYKEEVLPAPEKPHVVGRFPMQLYLSCNDDFLSRYQCLLRKQIELFEARESDIAANSQGRNKPIVLGQVGIRCIYCSRLDHKSRGRGSVFYPSKLTGVYQASQNMSKVHFLDQCTAIPSEIKTALTQLKQTSTRTTGGGKEVWAQMTKYMGVYEDTLGLRFSKTIVGS